MDLLAYLPFQDFTDPNKRIYWPYLLLCAIYATLFLVFRKARGARFGPGYWLHPSARVDYVTWILNHLLEVTLLPLLFINSLSIASEIYHWLTNTFGAVTSVIFMTDWGVIVYTMTYFVVSDFSRYGLHLLMHRYLWSIHRMHHTAEVLTPITFFRVHPLEMVLYHIRFLVVHSVVTGLFIYTYKVFDFSTILGASLFVFLSNVLGGNLRHSHIPIGFGMFERLFISPKQHQMHHSREPEMQHSNYGSFFAFWDLLFSTWKRSKGVKEIQFGVKGQARQSIVRELVYPLGKWIKTIRFWKRTRH